MPRRTSRSPRRIQRSAPRSKTRRSGPARSGIASSGALAMESSALGRDILASSPTAANVSGRAPAVHGRDEARKGTAWPLSSYAQAGVAPVDPPARALCDLPDERPAGLAYPARHGGFDEMTRPVRMALLAGLCLGAGALAGAADAPPPVLDRELFFGNPEIAAADLSPDGQYIAFLKPWHD